MEKLSKEMIEELIEKALEARQFSYAPYSNYKVGAALLTDGHIVTGCNIENASYPASNCAERTAIFKALSEGYRDIKAIAIVGGTKDKTDYAAPCGICRQTMREFCDKDEFAVIIAKSTSEYRIMSLDELLPESFGPENLN